MEEILSKSKNFTVEYCCTVVRVGQLEAVENSDNLAKTIVNGEQIVVNKNEIHEGDIMLYISNECQIANWFLSANNLYQHWELNANAPIVEQFLKQDPNFLQSDEMKALRGYFGDNGRVRMIRLRSCPSFGVLMKTSSLLKADESLEGFDWEAALGQDFDTVNGNLFVQAYVPPRKNRTQHGMHGVSRWDRFCRLVNGQFKLHYDTAPLKRYLDLFNMDTSIAVTVKVHGTSFICGNLLVNTPLRFFKLRRMLNRFFKLGINETKQEYGMIVSSRKVIKNEWANAEHKEGYYGQDIWTEYGNIIYPYIPKGITVYGEICGYLTNDTKMIQKDYDYGCRVGDNFLMPYRITEHRADGIYDYDIDEVIEFTHRMTDKMKACSDPNFTRIFNIEKVLVFEGLVRDLPSIDTDNIESLTTALAMQGSLEANEPLCKKKVPREGVVVRINKDQVSEAFKLKALKFMEREAKLVDGGEVDIEMANNTEEQQT